MEKQYMKRGKLKKVPVTRREKVRGILYSLISDPMSTEDGNVLEWHTDYVMEVFAPRKKK